MFWSRSALDSVTCEEISCGILCYSRKAEGLESELLWTRILAVPFTSCVTLYQVVTLSELHRVLWGLMRRGVICKPSSPQSSKLQWIVCKFLLWFGQFPNPLPHTYWESPESLFSEVALTLESEADTKAGYLSSLLLLPRMNTGTVKKEWLNVNKSHLPFSLALAYTHTCTHSHLNFTMTPFCLFHLRWMQGADGERVNVFGERQCT